ncbi:unnamed protein product [Rotaria socialis]|uniref:DnaJ-like protein n=1 Tax=Rotaria socialis TaxID=392032 RepID=A0A818ITM3_9BILA|nr:unnamed protein product [Rotaria socialis]CAF3306387.1 unnamed protein product [Rotaria socialis]CAF3528346.1 unnamed protein product [Rotaria socialis]CAF3651152.1 unnamed protein product [Rotaria socialis]
MKWCVLLFLLVIRIDFISAWENYELDLFDLVEELGVNTNFYDFIGVDKTAELSEIKKAYRKLSLLWHPDKSDEADAEQKFRHLVAVYEILKDEQRRTRYDRILVEGLPKWNQPIFYYRRAKKLRAWEILTILTLIFTIGHYLVLWAVYFESSLTMNEKSVDARKRLEKKMKKSNKIRDIDQNMIDEELARIIPAVPSPQLTDILPIKFAFFLVNHQFLIPFLKELLYTIISYRRQSPSIECVSADDEDPDCRTTKKSPVVRINDIIPEMAASRNVPVVSYLTATSPLSSEHNQSSESRNSNRSWSDEEKQLLCKTIVRFPPGTPRRWEKIADVIDRPVPQVIDMAKQIQNTVGSNNNNNSNLVQDSHSSFSSTVTIDQNLITERSQFESISDWSQAEQQLLECALKNIPKNTPGTDRWEQIAACIPGRTREECLARYRYIVQIVKAKKTA